jgi:hypothetical protein
VPEAGERTSSDVKGASYLFGEQSKSRANGFSVKDYSVEYDILIPAIFVIIAHLNDCVYTTRDGTF